MLIDCLEYKFGCTLNGHDIDRLPNNINVTFPQNITGESLLYMLDISNIKVSVGSACNASSYEPSHVLKAIGLTNEEAMRTVRFTLPEDIEYREIDKVIEENPTEVNGIGSYQSPYFDKRKLVFFSEATRFGRLT